MSARQQREPSRNDTAGNRTPSPRRSAWSSTTASSIVLAHMRARIDRDRVDTQRAAGPSVTPAPSRTQGPPGAEQEPRATQPEAARMILTATSCIEGSAILQHHDLVTAEAIVDANVLEQRHRAPRPSARRPHRAGRPPPHTAARGCPHCTERLSGASRHATGYRLKRGAPSGVPSTPASAHTAARIHRSPGRRPVRTHREQQPRATKQHAARAIAPSSRLPAAPEGNPEQAKNVPPAGNQTRLYCV